MVEGIVKITFHDKNASFHQGSIVKILSLKPIERRAIATYDVEQGGKFGHILKKCVTVEVPDWFVGNLTRAETEASLKKQEMDGAFVVRERSTTGGFAFCVHYQGSVEHFKIFQRPDGSYGLCDGDNHASLNELVAAHRDSFTLQGKNIALKNEPLGRQVRCSYDYEARQSTEINLRRGGIVTIVDDRDEDVWRGLHGGCVGDFPASYVRSIHPGNLKVRALYDFTGRDKRRT